MFRCTNAVVLFVAHIRLECYNEFLFCIRECYEYHKEQRTITLTNQCTHAFIFIFGSETLKKTTTISQCNALGARSLLDLFFFGKRCCMRAQLELPLSTCFAYNYNCVKLPQRPCAHEYERWKAHDCCISAMTSQNLKIVKKKKLKKYERLAGACILYSVQCTSKWIILMHRRIQPFLHRFQALSQAHKCH